MPGMPDIARAMAAQGMTRGKGMDTPETEAPLDIPPEKAPGDDFSEGLAMIQAAIAKAPPEIQQEAQTHLDALEAIADKIGAHTEEPQPTAEAAQPGTEERTPGDVQGDQLLGGTP